MRAIRKPALQREREDVVENLGNARGRVRQLQLAHARCVEQPSAPIQPMHLADGGRVATLAVFLADRLGGDAVGSSERVDQCRFADPG